MNGQIETKSEIQITGTKGWREGSETKSAYCSCIRPDIGFRHPSWADHNHLLHQLQGTQRPLLASKGNCAHMHTRTYPH